MSAPLNLLADIGGTNTRVAMADGVEMRAGSVRRYANANHDDLGSVIRTYQADTGISDVDGACVAAAGPVRDGVARMTNLSWVIDRDALAAVTKAEACAILNDLQAQGHALGHIDQANLRHILPQPAATAHAAKLVVGMGTGFNAAPVYDTDRGRFVPPSECGHVSLPVWDDASARVAAAVRKGHGFAAVEEVLSGRGLASLHAVLSGEERSAAEIMSAVAHGDSAAESTLRQAVGTLGRVMGDLALIHLPFGGISLVGGVARALAPYLEQYGFVAAMRDKGRFGPFLEQFGVSVIEDDFAALTGCAVHLTALAQA